MVEIKKTVIAGAGTMGYSMAEIFARYGIKNCWRYSVCCMEWTVTESKKNYNKGGAL